MRRILVYGVTGSGKSTLARRIAERLELPYVAVDDLMWEPGWVPVPPAAQRERIAAVLASEAWVLDAAYGHWRDLVLPRVELVVGLDLPRWRSFGRLLRRTVRNVASGAPTCNGNRETVRGSFLSRESILWWHVRSFARKRATMRAWHADPAMPETVLLRTPAEVRDWLRKLHTNQQ
jgi:adenylate kinase family enzyme